MSDFIEKLQEKRNRWVMTNKENDFEEGIISLLTELYPDNAHFIYELLQNAEDAEAQKVSFELCKNQLTFTHNGKKLFSESDIEAITNIGKGTKKDDVNKIGKFGVGFKAVFSYTQSPFIHSGAYNFKITDLVVPQEIKSIEKENDETVFIFPFNNELKQGIKAHDEIKEGLININRTTLLFLNSISEIEIKFPNESYSVIKHADKYSRITKITDTKLNKQTQFLVFSKPLPKEERLYVSIAFTLIKDNKTNIDKLTADNEAKVSIYFPAEKETSNLKFHIHAPFASTVARDSIKDRPENNELIDIIADLLCEATEWIKEKGFLNDDFIRCLPIEDDNISVFYKPIQSKIIDLFNNQPFLLCDDDEFHPAQDCWQSTKRLKDIISTHDLKTLLKGEINNDCFWAKRPSQRNASGRVYNFLKSLNLKTFNEDDFKKSILSLSEDFEEHPLDIKMELMNWKKNYGTYNKELSTEIGNALESRLNSNEIVIRLYNFVKKVRGFSYFRSSYSDRDIKNIIKANYSHIVIKELLSKKDNSWLKSLYELLFDIIDIEYDDYDDMDPEYKDLRLLIKLKDGHFNFSKSECYFQSETSINSMQSLIVDSTIYDENINEKKASKSKRFLKHILGVKEIGIEDEVIHLLKKYEEESVNQVDDVINHIKLFLKFFEQNKSYFDKSIFSNVFFLINIDYKLSIPGYILIDEPIEETSLSLLAEEKYKPLHPVYFESKYNISKKLLGEFLSAVGCCSTLPIEETMLSWGKRHKMGGYRNETDHCINENYCIPLQQCFKSPTIETSCLIWNEISALKKSVYFEAKYRANSRSDMHTCDSDVIEILKISAWIPDTLGEFHKPADIKANNLHKDFSYNDNNGWLTRIGLGQNVEKNQKLESVKDDLKEHTGYNLSTLEKLRKAGVTEEGLQQFVNDKKREKKIDLKKGIRNHDREISNVETHFSPSIVSDNEKYREKAQQQLYKNISRSESNKKSYNYSKNVKVGKDETIEFLRKQYQGHCQICSFTFSQSGNKGNYFEMFDWLSEKISNQGSNIIDVGSSLSLCSRCHSVLKYGDFGADFLDNIQEIENSDYSSFAEYFDLSIDGDDIPKDFEFIEMDMFKLPIRKLNKEEFIFFTEEHFIHFHNVLTLNKENHEEEGVDEQEVVELDPERVVEIGDIVTVKYGNLDKPIKLKVVSTAHNRKDKEGNNLISIQSPLGMKIKGQPIKYIFEMGDKLYEILDIK
jgi:hypothetical protein